MHGGSMKKKSFMLTELPANAAVLNDRCGAFKRIGTDVYGCVRRVRRGRDLTYYIFMLY